MDKSPQRPLCIDGMLLLDDGRQSWDALKVQNGFDVFREVNLS